MQTYIILQIVMLERNLIKQLFDRIKLRLMRRLVTERPASQWKREPIEGSSAMRETGKERQQELQICGQEGSGGNLGGHVWHQQSRLMSQSG